MKKKIKRKKCFFCKKKLSSTLSFAMKCKCENYFCSKHKSSRIHNCSFDYKLLEKKKILENNPKSNYIIKKI